jgi:hypothetical protein
MICAWKITHKKRKSEEISCFEVLDVLFGGGRGGARGLRIKIWHFLNQIFVQLYFF